MVLREREISKKDGWANLMQQRLLKARSANVNSKQSAIMRFCI
jgi:hypothetical protein